MVSAKMGHGLSMDNAIRTMQQAMGMLCAGRWWDLIENPEQIMIWGLSWSGGSVCKISKNGECHELHEYILIDISLVNKQFHFS